jgi:hypothetical protein
MIGAVALGFLAWPVRLTVVLEQPPGSASPSYRLAQGLRPGDVLGRWRVFQIGAPKTVRSRQVARELRFSGQSRGMGPCLGSLSTRRFAVYGHVFPQGAQLEQWQPVLEALAKAA